MATFRVYTKHYPQSSLSVTADKDTTLAETNTEDSYQQWYQKPVKQGIALVNKATNLAIEYVGYGEPVRLTPFDPTRVPDTQKWAKGPVVVDNYYPMYAVNDRELVFDAVKQNSIQTSNWNAGYSQLWTIQLTGNHRQFQCEEQDDDVDESEDGDGDGDQEDSETSSGED